MRRGRAQPFKNVLPRNKFMRRQFTCHRCHKFLEVAGKNSRNSDFPDGLFGL